MPESFAPAIQEGARAMGWKAVTLQGWGRSSSADCLAARPERSGEMAAALAPPGNRTLIAHGGGRSYGDAALNTGGAVVLTGRLDRILSFDPSTGLLVSEPGVTFAELLAIFLPRGFIAPVSPGTGFVTLGGALANDVHGKNHHGLGSIGDHVAWFDLLLPDGRLLRVAEATDPDLFRATIGGIGLTGIITAICLRLAAVPSNALTVQRRRVANLDDFLQGFKDAAGTAYSVGWIDALAQGAALGRGVLETAEASPHDGTFPSRKAKRFPIDAPGWLLNGLSVRAFNALYWRRASIVGQQTTASYAQFLYPLDAIEGWNRMYGKQGFRQFQCVVPFETGERALRRLLETIASAGAASFLAVLKVMGAQGRGMLSFGMPGYSLALDIPSRPGSEAVFAALERITRDAGGRIYLAKDSVMSSDGFNAMYSEAGAFRALRERIDPQRRLASDMSRRLKL
ncbi:FAD-binding oxidoreductase [Paeniroseomonas aquatica]|uniref:FAD-binding oxidoreductase n=1 Tax=Paeniroseomonas aquatica TaxID=373043 RepID=A0ABT8A886_9PROT|nr:FAD-binding oxidoreductase [Paeniroseomonas aquatica]MDN3565826.1 FAD-binding oxidoreductase [Paeniroseomonas aquatica]